MRTLGQITVTCYLTLGASVAAQAQTATDSQKTEAAASPAQTDAKPEIAWEQQRDYSLHRYNSLLGSTGLIHTVSADSGAPGTFRISFLSSNYTGSGFLCPTPASCGLSTNAKGNEDSVSRTGADLSISATLAPFLEATAGTHSHAQSDNFGTPSVIQVLGDSFLGLKGFAPRKADQILSAGGLGQLRFLNSAGNIGINTADITLAALATVNLSNRTDPKRRVPVRFHLNFGYLFDNSSKIADKIEQDRTITRIERNGFGINRVDSLFMGIGTEYVGKILQPFAEWTVDIASNRQGYKCITRNLWYGDECQVRASGMSGTPSRLTLGTRLTPQFHGLSGTVAFDIGTSGSAYTDERTTELPWNLYLGLAYAIDTVSAPAPAAVQKAPEAQIIKVPPPPEYHIQGTVVDEESSQPIAHAQIRFDAQDYTGLLSRANGTFESGNVKPGEYKLLVTAEGYKDGTCSVTVEAGVEGAKEPAAQTEPSAAKEPAAEADVRNSQVKCSLKAAPALGTVYGTLVDADSGAPVPQAALKVRDERDRALELQSNETGAFRVENVPAGQVHILITATGYLPMNVDLEIKKKVEQHAALVLHKLPKKPNVTVSPKGLKLSTQVKFEGTSAEISRESQGIVQEIAATLAQHSDIPSVEIQVYTDEEGSATYNKRLSEQRAGTLRSALIALGVDSSRLTATGFGSEKPIVPNATKEADRVKNRRVLLVIPKHD